MATISFRLSTSSGVAPYLQIAQQVRHAVRLGRLQPGDQLPTVKEVVGQVAVNPNTVLKAYRELEHDRLVEGRPGLGTFVVGSLAGPDPESQVAVRRGLERWLRQAFDAGFAREDVGALVESTLDDLAAEDVA